MRANTAPAKLFQQSRLEIRRHRMLQPLRLFMDLGPLHTEDLVQHALDEVMADGEAARNLAALAGEMDAAFHRYRHQAVALQAPQRHRYRRRRNREPVRKRRRDHRLTFALGFQDCLEIVLFGYRDHRNLDYTQLINYS